MLVFALLVGCQKTTACFDAATVMHVFGCNTAWCEVVIDDGAIVRVPQNQAILGAKVCLDNRGNQ